MNDSATPVTVAWLLQCAPIRSWCDLHICLIVLSINKIITCDFIDQVGYGWTAAGDLKIWCRSWNKIKSTKPFKVKSSLEKLTGYDSITLIYFAHFGYKLIRIIQKEYNGLLDLWYLERCLLECKFVSFDHTPFIIDFSRLPRQLLT